MEYLRQYVQYILNTAQVPLSVAAFDEDWEPSGPRLRPLLVEHGLITESDDGLRVTDVGRRVIGQ